MECVFGLVGDGFALVVADTSAMQSIIVQKTSEDKIMILDSHKLLGASGEGGDRVQFTEYIQKNVLLYQFRNGIPLTTAAAANFTRGELATALRKSYVTGCVHLGCIPFWVLGCGGKCSCVCFQCPKNPVIFVHLTPNASLPKCRPVMHLRGSEYDWASRWDGDKVRT
eukprot:Gb_19480 [translate_table: standard]